MSEPALVDRFRATQRLAFASLVEVRDRLAVGMSERAAADAIERSLARRGVRGWFHRPYAWFGDRTTLRGMTDAAGFAPTDRLLVPGMPVILDVAPVHHGVCADVALSFASGDNAIVASAHALLRELRAMVLAAVRAERSLRAIYRAVDAAIRDAGFASWHRRYPLGTLGHRVTRMVTGRVPLPTLGLGVEALARLSLGMWLARAGWGASPVWNDSALADRPASPGLWAIEPHVGTPDVGVKFEELMVVTPSDAYWLDDDVPHAKRNIA